MYFMGAATFIFYMFTFYETSAQLTEVLTQIQTALNLGNTSVNYTREECVWRPTNNANTCPDPDIRFILYTKEGDVNGEVVDMDQGDWLRHSGWRFENRNIVYIHGYGGSDGSFPNMILRDAYIRNGSYNVFVVDWGPLGRIPCYPAAVHNIKVVGQCTAKLYDFIRDTGVEADSMTCVGHSLGAHACGLISNHLQFRMHRIVALDPARPLIRKAVQLRQGAASAVQVLHTNAGVYGAGGRLGKVDFCLNGGKIQPACENTGKAELCSHILSLCYMAASIDGRTAFKAHPCTRRCPSGSRPTHRVGLPVLLGEHTPLQTAGSYCVTSKSPPYCPTESGVGHPWCCLDAAAQNQTLDSAPPLDDNELPD